MNLITKTASYLKLRAKAKQEIFKQSAKIDHTERVLASALNGVYIENGRKVTLCRLSAAGECK